MISFHCKVSCHDTGVKVQNVVWGCRMQDPWEGCNSGSPSVVEQ